MEVLVGRFQFLGDGLKLLVGSGQIVGPDVGADTPGPRKRRILEGNQDQSRFAVLFAQRLDHQIDRLDPVGQMQFESRFNDPQAGGRRPLQRGSQGDAQAGMGQFQQVETGGAGGGFQIFGDRAEEPLHVLFGVDDDMGGRELFQRSRHFGPALRIGGAEAFAINGRPRSGRRQRHGPPCPGQPPRQPMLLVDRAE